MTRRSFCDKTYLGHGPVTGLRRVCAFAHRHHLERVSCSGRARPEVPRRGGDHGRSAAVVGCIKHAGSTPTPGAASSTAAVWATKSRSVSGSAALPGAALPGPAAGLRAAASPARTADRPGAASVRATASALLRADTPAALRAAGKTRPAQVPDGPPQGADHHRRHLRSLHRHRHWCHRSDRRCRQAAVPSTGRGGGVCCAIDRGHTLTEGNPCGSDSSGSTGQDLEQAEGPAPGARKPPAMREGSRRVTSTCAGKIPAFHGRHRSWVANGAGIP